jgi:hypothetical protein
VDFNVTVVAVEQQLVLDAEVRIEEKFVSSAPKMW